MSDYPPQHVTAALEALSQISRAPELADAEALLLAALRRFNISYYAAYIASDPEQTDPSTNTISNWPTPWVASYIAEKKYKYDPVVIRAISEPGSFYWHELTDDLPPLATKLMRDAQGYGMIDGFTVSLRTSGPIKTLLSLAGEPLAWNTVERETVFALATNFIFRAIYLRLPNGLQPVHSLSPQQMRILHLAAQGMSDNQISRRLQIHRGTALAHWARIRSKLRASSRAHAVAIALGSGLIAL